MSQAGKGHVPEENLKEYRELASVARRFKSLGNSLSNLGYHDAAGEAWYHAEVFWDDANALRVDLPSG